MGWRPLSVRHRALWLQRWSQCLIKCWRIEVQYTGQPPSSGLVVCNHVSYLDILVLCARQPMVFVAKSEVRRWPIFGWLAQLAGTRFIRRSQKSDVVRMIGEMCALLQEGIVVALFPEGTSTNGSTVLPFRSPLLAAASRADLPAFPAWVGYQVDDGDAAMDVCFWGDMLLVPHLVRMASRSKIRASVRFGAQIPPLPDRKAWAELLHDDVARLGNTQTGSKQNALVSRTLRYGNQ
jgi:lyso-ornithine lipid O-acyltransferase